MQGDVQVQQGRDEVTLEFPVDDTGAEREDALVGMSFHVPRDTSQYAGDDETASSKACSLLVCLAGWGCLHACLLYQF